MFSEARCLQPMAVHAVGNAPGGILTLVTVRVRVEGTCT